MIDKLLGEGFEIRIGPHVGRVGYWAEVLENDSDSDNINSWESAGHGFIVEEALKNAELITRGQKPETEYKLEDFPTGKDYDEWFDDDWDDYEDYEDDYDDGGGGDWDDFDVDVVVRDHYYDYEGGVEGIWDND